MNYSNIFLTRVISITVITMLFTTSCNRKKRLAQYDDIINYEVDIKNTDAKTLFTEGLGNLQNGNYYEAKKSFLQADTKSPDNATILNALGNITFRIKKSDSAAPYFRRALQVDSNFIPTYSNYGAYLNGITEYEEAIKILSLGLRKINNDAGKSRALNLNLANSYYFLQDDTKALRLLDLSEKGLTDGELFRKIESFKRLIKARSIIFK